jgi:hypothetical protein
MRPQPHPQQFIPLTDDEIERLLAQGWGHLLQPYRVGSTCLPRSAGSDPLPRPDWPKVA